MFLAQLHIPYNDFFAKTIRHNPRLLPLWISTSAAKRNKNKSLFSNEWCHAEHHDASPLADIPTHIMDSLIILWKFREVAGICKIIKIKNAMRAKTSIA